MGSMRTFGDRLIDCNVLSDFLNVRPARPCTVKLAQPVQPVQPKDLLDLLDLLDLRV